MQTWKIATAVLAGCLVGAASTQAASISYPGTVVVQDGYYDNVVETSITDTLPLYGPPTAGAGNSLVYHFSSFSASASDSNSDITSGALEMTFDADPGQYIQSFSLTESGTYTISGTGEVTAGGTLTIRYYDDVAGEFVTLADPIEMSVAFPMDTPDTNGTWEGFALIDLNALGIQTSHIIIALDNNLIAGAGAGGSATITKDTMTINPVVPEPASMVLMGLGCLMILRKR